MSQSGTPGFSGLMGIIGSAVIAGLAMTAQDGSLIHWPVFGLAILVGLWAVQAVNR